MKRLPPAKRNQLFGVIAATLALICLVYFLLISPQNAKNQDQAMKIGQERPGSRPIRKGHQKNDGHQGRAGRFDRTTHPG